MLDSMMSSAVDLVSNASVISNSPALTSSVDDVICIDSDGDTEERALLISDTEEDLIFVLKIDGRKKGRCNKIIDLSTDSFRKPLNLSLGDSGITCRNAASLASPDVPDLLTSKAEQQSHVESLLGDSFSSSDSELATALKPDVLDLTQPLKSEHQERNSPNASLSVISPSDQSSPLLNVNTLKTNGDVDVSADLPSLCDSSSSDGNFSDNCSDCDSSDSDDSLCTSLSRSDPSSDSDSSLHSLASSNYAINTPQKASSPMAPASPWSMATPMFDQLLQFPARSPDKKSRAEHKTLVKPSLETKSCPERNEPNVSSKRSNDNLQLSMVPFKKRKPDIVPRQPKSLFSCGEDDLLLVSEMIPSSSVIVPQHGECSQCQRMIEDKLLLRCLCGRHCCNQCLEKQITTLLAKGQKGLPKCGSTECELTLDLDKLNGFLPRMVMIILRKKIEEEAIGDIMEWLKPPVKEEPSRKDIEKAMDLPKYWEPMMEYEDFRLVELRHTDIEFIEIHNMFHLTMHGPRARITRIQRIQNPSLWRFYSMKFHLMNRDLSASWSDVIERQLFHGTKREHIDAICRDNFDWRMCGVHGTVYGMGTYFARDATYSHRYTDQPPSCQSQRGPGMPSFLSAAQMALASTHLGSAHLTSNLFHSYSMTPMTQHCMFKFPNAYGPPNMSIASSIPKPLNLSMPSVMTSGTDPMLSQQPNSLHPKPSVHSHVMFVAKVLTGRYTLGKQNLRKPPNLEINSSKYYDSCVNNMDRPSIFVVFEKSQCYPEYIIEYTNDPV